MVEGAGGRIESVGVVGSPDEGNRITSSREPKGNQQVSFSTVDGDVVLLNPLRRNDRLRGRRVQRLLVETKSHGLHRRPSAKAACASGSTQQTQQAPPPPERANGPLSEPATNACTQTGGFATVTRPFQTHIDLEKKVALKEIAFLATMVANVAAGQIALP